MYHYSRNEFPFLPIPRRGIFLVLAYDAVTFQKSTEQGAPQFLLQASGGLKERGFGMLGSKFKVLDTAINCNLKSMDNTIMDASVLRNVVRTIYN
jgi:hypothetical protein